MKISEYIEHLRERQAEHGDLEVVWDDDTEVPVPDFNDDPTPAFVLDR